MLEDKEILQLYQIEGKEDYAFNLIIRKYSERLYRHIIKMVNSHDDADDILQNTFIKVWRYLPDFREDSKLFTWLYRIATNETLTFLKKESIKKFFFISSSENTSNLSYGSDPFFNGDQIQLKLQKAIRKLPPKQRAVFNLKYFEELKYEEIVEILGGTVGSLKASYHIAHTKIEQFLKESD